MITPGVDAQGNPIDPRNIQDHFEVHFLLFTTIFIMNFHVIIIIFERGSGWILAFFLGWIAIIFIVILDVVLFS